MLLIYWLAGWGFFYCSNGLFPGVVFGIHPYWTALCCFGVFYQIVAIIMNLSCSQTCLEGLLAVVSPTQYFKDCLSECHMKLVKPSHDQTSLLLYYMQVLLPYTRLQFGNKSKFMLSKLKPISSCSEELYKGGKNLLLGRKIHSEMQFILNII